MSSWNGRRPLCKDRPRDTFVRRRSDTWMFQGHRDANQRTGPPPPLKVRGRRNRRWTTQSELNGLVGRLRLCCSTSAPLLSASPPLKWTSCPLVFKESERNKKGRQGERISEPTGRKKRVKTVSWLRELYHICKPSGTLHKLISLCIVVTVLCRYHLCFCKIIYSAKMVLFFFFMFFSISL